MVEWQWQWQFINENNTHVHLMATSPLFSLSPSSITASPNNTAAKHSTVLTVFSLSPSSGTTDCDITTCVRFMAGLLSWHFIVCSPSCTTSSSEQQSFSSCATASHNDTTEKCSAVVIAFSPSSSSHATASCDANCSSTVESEFSPSVSVIGCLYSIQYKSIFWHAWQGQMQYM
jgi:hypothetical protein